jgi:hypothetical protein
MLKLVESLGVAGMGVGCVLHDHCRKVLKLAAFRLVAVR